MRHMHGSYNDGINVLRLDSGRFALNIPGRRLGEFASVADAIAAAVCQLGATVANVKLHEDCPAPTEREIEIAVGRRVAAETKFRKPTDEELAIAAGPVGL